MAGVTSAAPATRLEPLPPASRRPRGEGVAALDPAALDDGQLLALAAGLSLDVCRRLLDGHGLARVARLTAAELRREAGLGRDPAVALTALFEVGRRVTNASTRPGWRIRTPADVAERLAPDMRHLEREELRVLQLNAKNVVTRTATVYVGNLAGSSVRVGEVFRDAVRSQSAALVVVHNHPSGDPAPSGEDLRITAELADAGRLLDIELLDHVIVAADGWVSLRGLGALAVRPPAVLPTR